MTKRDALRLKAGSIIIFGHTRNVIDSVYARRGRVLFVTENGAIRVEELGAGLARLGGEASGGGPRRPCRVVPYHHVSSVERSS